MVRSCQASPQCTAGAAGGSTVLAEPPAAGRPSDAFLEPLTRKGARGVSPAEAAEFNWPQGGRRQDEIEEHLPARPAMTHGGALRARPQGLGSGVVR